MINLNPVKSASDMESQRRTLARELYQAPIFDRGEVHAQKVVDPLMATKELRFVNLEYQVPHSVDIWQNMIQPNLPWAEDHFKERVSGMPLNPPPSEAWWPFNRNQNAEHKKEEKFSHTYPERFWPRTAGDHYAEERGIRFQWGDLGDVISILEKNPRSRQAYLPVWFPEDLWAAKQGERVPCTLGYHFMINELDQLEMYYPMRSCDFLRFMVDDIYMAGRLLQWVAQETNINKVGRLGMSISSLHIFKGDEYALAKLIDPPDEDEDSWLAGVSG